MGEGERLLGSLGAGDDYSHLLRLLDDGEKFVNVDLAGRSQKLKAETSPDHRGGCQHELFILVEPPQTADAAHTHVFPYVTLTDLYIIVAMSTPIYDLTIC